MPKVNCLSCGETIKFPQYIIESPKYTGQLVCQECKSILQVKKEGSNILEYKLVMERADIGNSERVRKLADAIEKELNSRKESN